MHQRYTQTHPHTQQAQVWGVAQELSCQVDFSIFTSRLYRHAEYFVSLFYSHATLFV